MLVPRKWLLFVPGTPGSAYSADLSAASIAVTPQEFDRTNDYIAQLSAAVYSFVGQAIERTNDYVNELTASVFNISALDVTYSSFADYVAELSAATCAMTTSALTRLNAWAGELSAASMPFSGGALTYLQNTLMQLDAAVMELTGRPLIWTGDEEGAPMSWRLFIGMRIGL